MRLRQGPGCELELTKRLDAELERDTMRTDWTGEGGGRSPYIKSTPSHATQSRPGLNYRPQTSI